MMILAAKKQKIVW